MVVSEVNHCSQGLTVVKVILKLGVSSEGADTHLNPSISGDQLRFRQTEILHDSETLCVRTKIGMPKPGAAILIRIGKRKFVADGILFQEAERMTDANIVICFGNQSWPHEIRSEHDVEVRACASHFVTAGGRSLGLILRSARRNQPEYEVRYKKGYCGLR